MMQILSSLKFKKTNMALVVDVAEARLKYWTFGEIKAVPNFCNHILTKNFLWS